MNLKQLNKLTLLYVEDDKVLRANYLSTLSLIFGNVLEASCYRSALKSYQENKPDIILVDINLGELSGIDLVKKIRLSNLNIPIVFLTAHSDNRYLLEAANLQIDGYIVKPLDLDKLQTAMKNCLKKINMETIVEIGSNFSYNISNQELFKDKHKIILGKKTNELLQLFAKNPNKTITKEMIEDELWDEKVVTNSSIKNLIANIRKIIGKEKILNVMGIGWKLNIE
jgi:two-component system, OmpR family, response regulator VanR